MPRQNKRWDKGRKKQVARPLRRMLILCEDTKSARDYLASFPFAPAQVLVECVGTGMNTDSLMEQAIARKETALANKEPYESVWVVFDKDDFSLQQFNRAFDLARSHLEIVPCWSNECFELWYLLHFAYQDGTIGRKDILKKVSGHLGEIYDKGDATTYEKLLPKLEAGLKNAKRLAFDKAMGPDPHGNPSTHVHVLVEKLLELDPDNQ